jgi:hypothetical protein
MWKIDGKTFTKIPDEHAAFARSKLRQFVVGIAKTSLYVSIACNFLAMVAGQWSGTLLARMMLYHSAGAMLGVVLGFLVR